MPHLRPTRCITRVRLKHRAASANDSVIVRVACLNGNARTTRLTRRGHNQKTGARTNRATASSCRWRSVCACTHAGMFCRDPPRPDDWRRVHALGDRIHSSEANSKEAVRTLRLELRSGDLHVQRRAVRAWGLWSLSAGGTFGTYAANTQLLGILEDILNNSLTFPELREDTLQVLSALAYRVRCIPNAVQNVTALATSGTPMGTCAPREQCRGG